MFVQKLRLPGLLLLAPRVFLDDRGFFFESYQSRRYQQYEMDTFVQDNVSFSLKNTIRGLHFQSDPSQAKLVQCLQGEIWDVALDLRPNSPTFMKWEAVFLNDQNHHQFYLPKGFAHGFCTLSKQALVQYKVSSFYNPKTEKTIRWNDPQLAISWPTQSPILSKKDLEGLSIEEIQGALDYR